MSTIREPNYWPAVAMAVENDFGTISEGKWVDRTALKYCNLQSHKNEPYNNPNRLINFLYLSRLTDLIGSLCTTGN
jgi:hypothetical protein